MAAPELRIGCSGWNYRHWKGLFYPADLAASAWLRFYVSQFDTVEINATFYRLPEPGTFAAWREQTPDGFVMAVKGSRYLTHLKHLRDPEEPVRRLFEHAAPLGPRLGPVLYQLPGRLRLDLPRLVSFLDVLPASLPGDTGGHRLRHTIEFRDPSWYVDEVFALLDDRGVALCRHDMPGSAIDAPAVGPFSYVRFHGATGRYQGSYDEAALDAWARRFADERRAGRDVYAYFNNDADGMAPRNARALRDRACVLA